jgi:hypothetical protein
MSIGLLKIMDIIGIYNRNKSYKKSVTRFLCVLFCNIWIEYNYYRIHDLELSDKMYLQSFYVMLLSVLIRSNNAT